MSDSVKFDSTFVDRRLHWGTTISEVKLKAGFKRADTLNLLYVRQAKNIAERIRKGEEVDWKEIAEVRLRAVDDRDNLKGDFVISVFLELMEQGIMFDRWEKGRSIKVSDKLARKVFENELTKEISVTKFCQDNRLTRNKYYRIANCNVKDADKKAELENLKSEVARRLSKSD